MKTIPTKPLAGLTILDCSVLLPGPFIGKLLIDQGARVIKIENPNRPDPVRELGAGCFYEYLNLRSVGNIMGTHVHFSTEGLNLGRDRLCIFSVDIIHHDNCAFLRQSKRSGGPQAATRTRNQGHAIYKTISRMSLGHYTPSKLNTSLYSATNSTQQSLWAKIGAHSFAVFLSKAN